ncbi:MAG: baseplate J/gp47 family protein [Pseudohongiella sp.]|nr:baseplate J/gp47 family protein [Pseudohongiella sp.]
MSAIDLSLLPSPQVVETLNYETILAEMIADLVARDPDFTELLESDPAIKILEVAAYRELLVRQRVNDAARSVMLAFARGANLDQIGANFNISRLVIDPGDASAIPPEPEILESDTDFRARIQLALEGITTAGSVGSYVFHALGADADVRDIQALSTEPGVVTVYVLSRSGTGTASGDLIDKVDVALNQESVRPLTDLVNVVSAAIVEYAIEANLTMLPGPDPEVVRQSAEEKLTSYIESIRKIGYDVTLSGIYAALHQPGVQSVDLVSPLATIVIGDGEAAYCTDIAVTASEDTDV